MNAIYLHLPDGTPTKWSMCSECKTVVAPGNFDVSQKCCACYDCGLPLLPEERKCRSLYHRECERARRARREMEALEKAEIVIDYTGPVYFEGGDGSYGDGYFTDVDELAEWLNDQELPDGGDDRPEFAFCYKEIPFRRISLDSLIESACDDMDEDASERLSGVEELEKACNAFYEANKGVVSYFEDRKRKVRIPR